LPFDTGFKRAVISVSRVSNSPSQCALGLTTVSSSVWLWRRVSPTSSRLRTAPSE
jgi:hypothetical protein